MTDWFENILVDKDKLHYKFKYLLDYQYNEERNILKSWIKNFIIKDGKTKTIKEFQTTFHSTFFELYLNEVILNSGATISNNVKSPDFYIKKEGINICVEAVIANIAEAGEPESTRTLSDIYGENDYYKIVDESIIRTLGAITGKLKKYPQYAKSDFVKNDSFIIALADFSQVNYGQSYFYPLLAILYQAYYDPDEKTDLKIYCNDSLDKQYKYKDVHLKPNGNPLNLGLFSSDEYKHISAIIYTCTLTFGKLTSLSENHSIPRFIRLDRENIDVLRYSGQQSDESLCDGLFIFHNPFAEKPLPNNYFKGKGLTNILFNAEEYVIDIDCQDSSPLMRRRTGMKGDECIDMDDIDKFHFLPILRK